MGKRKWSENMFCKHEKSQPNSVFTSVRNKRTQLPHCTCPLWLAVLCARGSYLRDPWAAGVGGEHLHQADGQEGEGQRPVYVHEIIHDVGAGTLQRKKEDGWALRTFILWVFASTFITFHSRHDTQIHSARKTSIKVLVYYDYNIIIIIDRPFYFLFTIWNTSKSAWWINRIINS